MTNFDQYGHFDDEEGSFVVTAEPPRKWWNLHCTKVRDVELYAEVAHINDGQTWVRDAEGNTTVLCSHDAKYQYIRNETTGTVFCPAGNPAPTRVEQRRIEFFRERSEMSSVCEGLRAHQRVFVPQDVPVECTTVCVTNETDEPVTVSVFSYVMFALTGCDKEGNGVWKENFAEVKPEMGGVLCTNRNNSVPTDRFKAFLLTLENFVNANGYRDHFTRAEYATGTPKILDGWNCDGRPGYGPDCAGIVQVRLTIAPGETERADFVLGQAASLDEVIELRQTLSAAQLDSWCEEARQVEACRADSFKVDVGQPLYNGLFNIFLKKQLYNYLINKSGFRDNLQVDNALAFADYEAAETNFLRALASQYADGSVPHGFRPLNRLQYSDKPAWILMTLPGLVKESGRHELLEMEVPFFESSETATVGEHALRAMRFLAEDTGAHGLCNQHHADWNDGLEATEAAGERESVFVTQQLCYGARELAELAERVGSDEVAEEAWQIYETFKKRINEVAWDGEWYVRTLCGDGHRIGSKDCEEGQIFVNTQSWAVLSGVADEERARLCMSKVDELLEEDLGYRICFPPFSKYDPRVGRMSQSMPGANENGGCYNHAGGFKGVADTILGRAEEAWRAFVKITPDNPENPISRSGAEPFSYVNSYSSVPYVYGASGYAWRTGTAGWMALLLIEHILGARRGYEGLIIDPCLPKALPTAKLSRRFRGATYDIFLDNQSGDGRNPKKILFNGAAIEGNTLPMMEEGRFSVDVTL